MIQVIRIQLIRALPWLILAMTIVLVACNNPGSGGSVGGGGSGPAY